ncbi:MAG: metal ABC transporter ATP-binding protein [Anaerolineae bacterium]
MARTRVRRVPHDVSAPTVEVDRVSVNYNGKGALEDVSFRLEPGQRVAVVGPNGAGKSTLFKVIAGMLQPSAGKVRVYGHGPHGHICIAYVPQRSQIDWTFPVTVADVVMMGRVGKIGLFRWPTRSDWDVVHSSLEQVGVEHLANQQIGELSGGQQQRVFIARALAQEAELLLLDEPLTGLDMPSQEAIFQILDGLEQRGVTAMVATHDLNLASEHFDLMMLLNRQMMAFGHPDQVLTSEALLRAYGGHMHVLPAEDGALVLADTCCDGAEMDI